MSNSTLVMVIYNGRKDPQVILSMWGFDGPDIEDIALVKYNLGNLLLNFKNKGYLENAKELTNWQEQSNLPTIYELVVNLYNKNFSSEYIVTNEPERKETAYYGDYYIRPNDEYSLMITNICEMHCKHGTFNINLDSYADYQEVKEITNWQDAPGLFSLNVPISNVNNQVMVYSNDINHAIYLQNSNSILSADKCSHHVATLYESFELSLM